MKRGPQRRNNSGRPRQMNKTTTKTAPKGLKKTVEKSPNVSQPTSQTVVQSQPKIEPKQMETVYFMKHQKIDFPILWDY